MSQFATVLLNKLKAEQATYALGALRSPGSKSEYEFGLRVGYVAGMERGIAMLLSALDEERNGEKDLDARL